MTRSLQALSLDHAPSLQRGFTLPFIPPEWLVYWGGVDICSDLEPAGSYFGGTLSLGLLLRANQVHCVLDQSLDKFYLFRGASRIVLCLVIVQAAYWPAVLKPGVPLLSSSLAGAHLGVVTL